MLNEQDVAHLITLFTVLIVGLSLIALGLYKLLFSFKTKHPIKGKR